MPSMNLPTWSPIKLESQRHDFTTGSKLKPKDNKLCSLSGLVDQVLFNLPSEMLHVLNELLADPAKVLLRTNRRKEARKGN